MNAECKTPKKSTAQCLLCQEGNIEAKLPETSPVAYTYWGYSVECSTRNWCEVKRKRVELGYVSKVELNITCAASLDTRQKHNNSTMDLFQ